MAPTEKVLLPEVSLKLELKPILLAKVVKGISAPVPVLETRETVPSAGKVILKAAPASPVTVKSAVEYPVSVKKAAFHVYDLWPEVASIVTVYSVEVAIKSPNCNSVPASLVIPIGVMILAPAFTPEAVAVLPCPKEIVEKAKMAAESVKNIKIVVFIMNILNVF